MHCVCAAAVNIETLGPENYDWLIVKGKLLFCPSLTVDVTGVCTPVSDDVTAGVTCGRLV